MIFGLMLKGLARGKARFACAAAGVAAAVGAVVFTFSLAATTAAQAPALAKRASAPWAAWRFDSGAPANPGGAPDLTLDLVGVTVDYRPGGRVLQGPPMRAVIAAAPAACPYGCTRLEADGRWVDDAAAGFEIVCTRNALKRFGRGMPPPPGTEVKFVGETGTMSAKIVGYLAETKLPRGWPDVFANKAAFAALRAERHGTLSLWKAVPGAQGDVLTARSESVTAAFTGDEQRRLDYARPLMLVAAVLTALCLLVNSLLLSVESNRRMLATLRTVGLTRAGVAGLVVLESLAATCTGWLAGAGLAIGALAAYVSADPVAFPVGMAVAAGAVCVSLVAALAVAVVAVLFALHPALAVRPLDALEERPRRRRRGMAIAFACGFGAFVAVEVWGASLMRGFVPSPEWPDAIVSILPEGVSSFDIGKLRALPGVRRISELCPLQVDFDPVEPMRFPGRTVDSAGGAGRGGPGGRGRRPQNRNALLLAAEWLPDFTFVEGTRAEAERMLRASDACVVAQMVARSRNLHVGDRLRLSLAGRGPATVVELPVAGVVDVNWHMVTSRGLVRGLNGAPVMTDGVVFVSFDTLESLDPRPAFMTKMTHLWVEYEPAFLKEKGVFPAGRAVEASIAKVLGLATSQVDGSPAAQPSSTVRLHARDEIADGTLAHGSDLVGAAARVPFVFLAILSFGFVAMLVADADAARRTFAVLRAVGATRGQLAARLTGGALKVALRGMAFGLPVGALAGWLFSIRTAAIWPGMPHYFEVPWRVIAEGSVGALVFVLAVAVPTALALVGRRRG